MTYAELASGIAAKQEKYNKIISDPMSTAIDKKTAQMNLQQLNQFADEVFASMEEDKEISSTGKFAYGGYIDEYYEENPYIKAKRDAEYVRYNSLSEQINSQKEFNKYPQLPAPPVNRKYGPVKQQGGSAYSRIVLGGKTFNQKFVPKEAYDHYDYLLDPNIDPQYHAPMISASEISTGQTNNIGKKRIREARPAPPIYAPMIESQLNGNTVGGVVDTRDKYNMGFNDFYGIPKDATQSGYERISEDPTPVAMQPKTYESTSGIDTSLRGTQSNTQTQSENQFDYGQLISYAPAIANTLRGTFGKVQKKNPSDYFITRKITPQRMDISAPLSDIDSASAISRSNIRSGSPTQIMSGNIATNDWATRAKAGLYGNKFNVDQESRTRSQLADLENEKNNIQTRLQIEDMNDRAQAAKDNILGTGISQAMEAYYRNRNDGIMKEQMDLDNAQFKESMDQRARESASALKAQRDIFEGQAKLERDRMAQEKEMFTIGNEKYKESYPYNADNYYTGNGSASEKDLDEPTRRRVAFMTLRDNEVDYPISFTDNDKKAIAEYRTPEKLYDQVDNFIRHHESGNGKDIYNDESGASGVYQMMAWTASDQGLKIHPELEKLVALQRKANSKNDTKEWYRLAGEITKLSHKLYTSGELQKKDERFTNPKKEAQAAKKLIMNLATKYDYDLQKVLAAYSGGTSKKDPLVDMKPETVNYLDAYKKYEGSFASRLIDNLIHGIRKPSFMDSKGNQYDYIPGEISKYQIVSGPDFKEKSTNSRVVDFLETTMQTAIPGKFPSMRTVKTNPLYPNLSHAVKAEISGSELLGGAFKKIADLPIKGVKAGTKAIVNGVKYVFKNGQWSQFVEGAKGVK